MSSVLPSVVRPLAAPSLATPSPAEPAGVAAWRGDAGGAGVAAGEAAGEAAGPAETRRHLHLVVRVGEERFALPLDSVAEGVESPVLLTVAGMTGQWLGLMEWRGRRIPLGAAGAAFGRDAAMPCVAALILDDATQPLALAVDELCDARALPPSAVRPFAGRRDPPSVVRAVAWDDDGLVAVVSTPAVRQAMLAAATAATVPPTPPSPPSPPSPSSPSPSSPSPAGVPTGTLAGGAA
ncbi:MAG: chemotaxis protein CheW [Gemmatimonadaceae bacterium]